ncbi:hypothetical protein MLD63_11775 [Paracoccus sp. TK19116]|uniref:RNA polymerase subunit sigma-70 n=1 Tax=Paracoccus albicereus TaxID=2922394 RepID=A0ABT1MS26_9RHOB|nr:hypothetical protein [Paracoccus albicereus]MCQ0971102.1 hypothetical protein [Paracoccus albicereus]
MSGTNTSAGQPCAHRVRQLSSLDIPGGGQVVVQGDHVFVGHMRPPYGTTIIDVSDRSSPKVVAQIKLDDNASHSHKVRVAGDLMITNVEQDDRHAKRRANAIPEAEAALKADLGRSPTDDEIAERIGADPSDMARLRGLTGLEYGDGGFRVWDIADCANPKLLTHHRTGGVGVHRFDMDATHAYISTEMEGYKGNILVVYDLADPANPAEVGRWWMPGQHVAGGETPHWSGLRHRLHHAMKCGDELWASVWHAGFRVIDARNLSDLQTIGEYDYHPAIPEPTHTAMPFENPIGGRRIAAVIDEEHDHEHGRLHGFLWLFDASDLGNMKPLSIFTLDQNASPYSRAPGRFGAHQFHERLDSTLIYAAWFSGGLRIIDAADPEAPVEVGYFVPEPLGDQPAPQSNDVAVGEDGTIYLLDRNRGLLILKFE